MHRRHRGKSCKTTPPPLMQTATRGRRKPTLGPRLCPRTPTGTVPGIRDAIGRPAVYIILISLQASHCALALSKGHYYPSPLLELATSAFLMVRDLDSSPFPVFQLPSTYVHLAFPAFSVSTRQKTHRRHHRLLHFSTMSNLFPKAMAPDPNLQDPAFDTFGDGLNRFDVFGLDPLRAVFHTPDQLNRGYRRLVAIISNASVTTPVSYPME